MDNKENLFQENFESEIVEDLKANNLLQERLKEVNCAVLNYTNNRIEISVFYSEAMYKKYLSGVNCIMGMGLYDKSETVDFNLLDDEKLVVVQENGTEKAKYKYKTIFKAVMEYKNLNVDKKTLNHMTFKIRKNEFGINLNYMEHEGKSLTFESINEIKDYINNKYPNHKLLDNWELMI